MSEEFLKLSRNKKRAILEGAEASLGKAMGSRQWGQGNGVKSEHWTYLSCMFNVQI